MLHSPIESKPGDVDSARFMLIDMKTNSAETINLAAQHPEIVQRLKAKYEVWTKEVGNQ